MINIANATSVQPAEVVSNTAAEATATFVQKKAQESQAIGVITLLQSLPQVPAPGSIETVGVAVDTFA